MFKRVRARFGGRQLRRWTLPTAVIFFFVFLYLWQLGSLTGGISSAELSHVNSSLEWRSIAADPINAPHRLAQLAFYEMGHLGQATARLVSVLFMTLFVGLFYLLLRLWYGKLAAFAGVFLLAGTPWLILVARSATAEVLLLAPIALMSQYLWLTRRQTRQNLVWLSLAVTAGLIFYVPGGILLLAAAVAIKFKDLVKISRDLRIITIIASGLVLVGLIVPIVWAAIEDPKIIKAFLLVPEPLPDPLALVKQIGWAISSLFWRLPSPSDLTLGRLPLLTISILALAAFGIYAMVSRARRETYELLALAAGSVLAAGIANQLALLLPAVMIACVFAAAGLRYLFVEWNGIFPRNPLPRYFAVTLVVILVGLHLVYGIRYSLVAWPRSPATDRAYMLELSDK